MSAEYTPTTDEVREAWADHQTGIASRRQMHRDDFDRWLAAHEAEITARALDEAADAQDADPEFRDPLRLKSDWLRNRAARLRGATR